MFFRNPILRGHPGTKNGVPGGPPGPKTKIVGRLFWIPILGICYGLQILAEEFGGRVEASAKSEFGFAQVSTTGTNHLLDNICDRVGVEGDTHLDVWMSHGDRIDSLPPGFESKAFTDNSPIAVIGNNANLFGIQFHPEVVHTPQGKEILENFLFQVCEILPDWTPGNFVNETVEKIREQVGDGKVICALSGGVDSAVAATLVHKAVGDQLTCIFVNNGLMRKEEPERVQITFETYMKVNFIFSESSERFIRKLKDVTDPERKRKIIGEEFINVFDEEANRLGEVDFLTQGTLYPDVIESSDSSVSATIKTHHNVGGLPDHMKLKLIEPLRYLFKDEVRQVGLELGLSEEMVFSKPFPGT